MSQTETDKFLEHTKNAVFPKNLSLNNNGPFGAESALLRGVIESITGLHPAVPEQNEMIEKLYVSARHAVVDSLQEQGAESSVYKQWTSHQGDYKSELLGMLGASVSQFATQWHDRLVVRAKQSPQSAAGHAGPK
jgi:hypothetical protein